MKTLRANLKTRWGFQYTELLIVFAIAAILVVLSLPHYSSPHTAEKRLRAELALHQLAGQLEEFYAQNKTYEGAKPKEPLDPHYRLTILKQSAKAYEIAAIPQGSQAENDQHCGTLILDSEGRKQISGQAKLYQCW